jgi:hypothetical protein
MEIRRETQQSPVADEVSALIAVARPILVGLLWGLKADVVAEVGEREDVKLKMLPRLRRASDGDCGICFEYAVHDAMRRGDQMVQERVDHALTKLCNVPGSDLDSILFAAEKSGSEQLIDTARDLVTSQSQLMYGTRGRPASLQKHIEGIAQAFRRPAARAALPYSISGVWKADLIVGKTDSDKWVGTSVKINPDHLEGAKGLRIGIVPVREGENDLPFKDERRNLVVCPLLHDGNFMQVFYEAWLTVQQFLAADAKLPKEVAVPRPASRQLARLLAERCEFPVVDVVEALGPIAQPELLATRERKAQLVLTRGAETDVQSVLAPQARKLRARKSR